MTGGVAPGRSPGMRARGTSRVAMAVLGAAVFALALLAGAGEAHAVEYGSQEIALVNLVNDYRVSLGRQPLMVSDLASDAAEKHSSDMGKYDFFAHNSFGSDWFPWGANASVRLAMCGYSYQIAWGETIAAGQTMAQTVFNAWKNSPTHDSVMREPSFRVVGVGLVHTAGSQYGNYWTLDFGGHIDPTAHWIGSEPTTTSTSTTSSSTTTTTAPPTTTTTGPPASTTTTTVPGSTTTAPSFSDVPPNHPFYVEITDLAQRGIVSGTGGGLFRPDDRVTRAQFAKVIVLALDEHTPAIANAAAPTYSDVPYTGNPYPFDFVEEAAALGIIQGFADGTFKPGADVTRAQLSLMLTRAGDQRLTIPPPSYPCPFGDVPGYAQEAVRVAFYNSLLDGKSPTVFDPYGRATRGQVAKMVYRLLQALGI